MPRIKFSDGVEFNTEGAPRVERRWDGLYVVGDGFLCSVDSRESGLMLIRRIRERQRDKR